MKKRILAKPNKSSKPSDNKNIKTVIHSCGDRKIIVDKNFKIY